MNMPVSWKKNKNFKPQVVLQEIDKIKKVNTDKTVSYIGFSYYDAMATLQNMIDFPSGANGLNQESIVSMAVSNIAKDFALDQKKVIDEINSIVKENL